MAMDPSTEESHMNIASLIQAGDSDAPVRPTGSAHRSPIDAEPRAPSAADEPHSGLVDLWAVRSVPRTVRTTGRSCERRTNHRDRFGSHLWTDDLPDYGPTVGWQIQPRSRRDTFGTLASLNDDPHSTEYLIHANRVRSPIGFPVAQLESIGVKAGGHLRDTL